VRNSFLNRAFGIALCGLGVAAAVRWSAGWEFVVIACAYAAGHLVLISSPSGRRVPLLPAIAAGIALESHGSPVLVLAAAAAALPFGWLAARLVHGRRVTDEILPAEAVGLAMFGSIMAAESLAVSVELYRHALGLTIFGGTALIWFLTVALVRTLQTNGSGLAPRRLTLLRALADWPAYLALFSSGALYGLTVSVMGWWALPLAGLPYAFSHVSLHREQTTRQTYRQTIQALGAVPEAGGMVAAGHARRVAELSVAIGAEMGLSVGMLQRLEYAALLHDVGRVVLANPAISAGSYSDSDVSGWSSAIMSEARYLENVAEVVAAQHHPYRRPGEERDPDLPLASKILKATAAYDGGMITGLSSLESIEALHRGAAYDHDPEVVACLRRVLERRSK